MVGDGRVGEGTDASTLPPLPASEHQSTSLDEHLGLAVIWCRDQASAIGEVVLLPGQGLGLWGRGQGRAGPEPRLELQRSSPTGPAESRALHCPRISRNQLRLSAQGIDSLLVENVGACPLVHAGREVRRAELQPGDTISLGKELSFLCIRRAKTVPRPLSQLLLPEHRFGQADVLGLVGESPALWELRERLVAIGSQPLHVLIHGASGTGKELAAQAIHALSARRRRPMVSRNAATIPGSIADAELFGNARGYPNAGMPERPGLIGAAHESTLFLDELAELPLSIQGHLLRVLDNGEYQRLGESVLRRADIRVIGATNRPASSLKHDVLARLTLRLELPDLNARREDIPLLIGHLLRRHAAHDPSLARFFPDGDCAGFPRISCALVEALVKHDYRTNVRELDNALMAAALQSAGAAIELTAGTRTSPILSTAPSARAGAPPRASRQTDAWLTAEETARLNLLRQHRFSPTSCSRDPAYPGNRQTADLHFRHLVCKALANSGWEAERAAAVLAGDGDPVLLEKCVSRIETFVSNLELRVASEPKDQLERALTDDWKGLVVAVLPLVAVLRDKRSPVHAEPFRSA